MTAEGSEVPVPTAERRSPLGATATEPVLLSAAPGVEAWELPFTTQLDLRLSPDPAGLAAILDAIGIPIPTTPNQVETGRDARAIWLGPDEWLIVGPATVATPDGGPGDAVTKSAGDAPRGSRTSGRKPIGWATVGAAVRRAGGSVVDVSAHRTLLRLAGPRAAEILAHGCSIDLHPRSFAVGACAQTLLARVDVILERLGPEEYGVFVRASFAPYLVDWLRDAMGAVTAKAPPPKRGSGRRATPVASG